jgi:hypothetical protein
MNFGKNKNFNYDDPNFIPPEIKEWTTELLKDLEKDFGRRAYPIFSKQSRKWIETMFDTLYKDINYRSQYFGQSEFDRIRKSRGII